MIDHLHPEFGGAFLFWGKETHQSICTPNLHPALEMKGRPRDKACLLELGLYTTAKGIPFDSLFQLRSDNLTFCLVPCWILTVQWNRPIVSQKRRLSGSKSNKGAGSTSALACSSHRGGRMIGKQDSDRSSTLCQIFVLSQHRSTGF